MRVWLTSCIPLALALETELRLDGVLPEGGPDHVRVAFEVPEGTREIEVRHDDLSAANILDWGLDGPDGPRGWGGGNVEPAIVGERAASRSYRAGPIPAGTWSVVIGRAKVVETPARYAVTVVLRDTPTLPPQQERAAYAPAGALETGARWYAGDLHVHSRESGDADPTLDAVASAAEGRGLDFVVLSDHNTTSTHDLLVDAQARAGVLLVPGMEYTTYEGHAGILGATPWLDHRTDRTGEVPVEDALAQAHAAGAVVTVNHPNLDLGELCTGCAWELPVDPASVDAVEIVTGGYAPVGRLFLEQNLALWEAWLDQGARVAPVGGSDDHAGGTGSGPTYSPLGSPTTRVWARELSVDAIQEGLRAGRTVVQLQGPGDPFVELWPDTARDAPEVPDTATWTATVRGGAEAPALGGMLVWVLDGEELARVEVTSDPFTDRRRVDVGGGDHRVRVQLLVEDAPRVVTGHFWLEDAAVDAAPETCAGCAAARPPGEATALALGVMTALAGVRRRRRPA